MRPPEYYTSELEYLSDYIPRTFGTTINNEELKAQLSEMIKEKVESYVFQRFRDWTGPELAKLIAEIDKPASPAIEVKRRGRPPGSSINGNGKT